MAGGLQGHLFPEMANNQLAWNWLTPSAGLSSHPHIASAAPASGVSCILAGGGKGLVLINVCRTPEDSNSLRAYLSKCLTFLSCFVSEGPSTIKNIILLSGKNLSFIHYTPISVRLSSCHKVLIVWGMEE